jgi:hypothetical protein
MLSPPQLLCRRSLPLLHLIDIATDPGQTWPLYGAVRRTMIILNLILGTLVTTIGFWIFQGAASQGLVALWAVTVGGFLWWRVRSITELWAWATLLLGLESFAWPMRVMIQLKGVSETPSQDEMETMLTAVILGLFSAVFWIAFSYGLFKRARGTTLGSTHDTSPARHSSQPAGRKKDR